MTNQAIAVQACPFAEALEESLGVSHYEADNYLLIDRLDTLLSDCMALCSEAQLAVAHKEITGEEVIANKARWELPRTTLQDGKAKSELLIQCVLSLGNQIGLEAFLFLLSLSKDDCTELNMDNDKAFKQKHKQKTPDELASMLTTMNGYFTERQYMTSILGSLRVVFPRMTKNDAFYYDYCDVDFNFDDVLSILKQTSEKAGNNKALVKHAAFGYSILTAAQIERFNNVEALNQSLSSKVA